MNVRFVNPFVIAACEVLQQEVAAEVKRGDIRLEKASYTLDEVTALIGLTGQIEGAVLLGLSIDTALALVSQILGQKFMAFDDLAQSGIGELSNVITGRACGLLEKAGYSCQISPPTLIIGAGVRISTLAIQRLVIPLHTQYGDITVHLALRESYQPRIG